MKKNYQKTTAPAGTSDELVLPDAVTVAMAEIGGAVREGLLALAVATGLQVMGAMMEESVTALAGPRGRHQPDRTAVRHGTEAGSVVLGGRRVPVRRPRVGAGELSVEAYEVFADTDLLGDLALQRMMAKTLTISRLGVPPTLARTLRSTNAIESMIEICRDHSTNVKRWRDGQMALRWCAAGMSEAAKQFRRVNGRLHLPALRRALDAHVAATVTALCHDEQAA